MKRRLLQTAVLACCSMAVAASAFAQAFTGRIELTVVDGTGAVLPGATVELSGQQTATTVTDTRGEARFLNLAPGRYSVVAKLSGFGDWKNDNVTVNAGQIVGLRASMAVGGVATTVDVLGSTPTIDPKRTAQSTTISYEELQSIPSSRDPWVVLQTIPGVIVDRVNVGGAESGQQSNYIAKGASGGENTWTIDGVPVTDMSALGSSPTYYDFDMFQQMQATTGGADVTNATPGVALNFVLKSGTNAFRGSGRFFFENESMQANNLSPELAALIGARDSAGNPTGKGNRMKEYMDYGGELGGPILRDRLWFWGAYGKTDVTVLTLASTPDQTILDNYSGKLTAQVTPSLRTNFTYYRGEKQKFGRGASPSRPPETTWNQGGPTEMFKGEANLTIGNDTFLTGRYGYTKGGFFLTPQGGLDTNMYFDDGGIARGSYYEYRTDRPQQIALVEANHFRGRHEWKAGFSYRQADVDSWYTLPGNGIITYHIGYPDIYAEVTAWNQDTSTRGRYVSGFISDTISLDRLTITAGLRWDRQSSSVKAYSQMGNSILPDLLPDLTGKAVDDVIVWNSIGPRVGASYAIGDDRRTIARASYAAFASQMNAGQGGFFSTVGSSRGVYFYARDTNGNGSADASEIAAGVIDTWYGFNINNPANVDSPNHVIGDYKTPMTHEFILGLDREVAPNLGVSASYTFRYFNNFNWRPIEGLRSDDYEQRGSFSATLNPVGSVSVPYYGVKAGSLPADRSRTEYVTREGYTQRFHGLELAATKRMSNRWMARFGFSWNQHREYFDGPNAMTDPTPTPGNPNVNGGDVMVETTGSGKSAIYLVLPKYQFILNGLYQAPYGINMGVNLVNRQGYAMPYSRSNVATGDPLGSPKTVLLVNSVTDYRLPSVTSLDARLGKEFTLNQTRVNLDLDLFNVLNSATILGRQYDLRLTTADTVREIMNPRILRLGVRIGF